MALLSFLHITHCTLNIAVSKRRSVLLCRISQNLFNHPISPSTCSDPYNFLYLNSSSLKPCLQKILLKDYTLSGKFHISSCLLYFLTLHPSCYYSCSGFVHSSLSILLSSTICLNVYDVIKVFCLTLLWTYQSYV